jgi:glycine/D-amino acid oxidase-like deaminating enzyme
VGDGQEDQTKTPDQLQTDFARSLGNCRLGPRQKRWLRALETLENDPLFKEANVSSLLDLEEDAFAEQAARLFKRLSSGHKIVLLTITRLIELVDERTLVLLDEPEGHLHPPLLSAFVRALADLLIQRNGVAIIATHSPVVLQEVPASCVWVLRRNGTVAVAERPESETFGENVGVLTHSVFGLEATNTGFHKMLSDAVHKEGLDFDGVMAKFDGQLGAEAMAIARSLTVSSQRSN